MLTVLGKTPCQVRDRNRSLELFRSIRTLALRYKQEYIAMRLDTVEPVISVILNMNAILYAVVIKMSEFTHLMGYTGECVDVLLLSILAVATKTALVFITNNADLRAYIDCVGGHCFIRQYSSGIVLTYGKKKINEKQCSLNLARHAVIFVLVSLAFFLVFTAFNTWHAQVHHEAAANRMQGEPLR